MYIGQELSVLVEVVICAVRTDRIDLFETCLVAT